MQGGAVTTRGATLHMLLHLNKAVLHTLYNVTRYFSQLLQFLRLSCGFLTYQNQTHTYYIDAGLIIFPFYTSFGFNVTDWLIWFIWWLKYKITLLTSSYNHQWLKHNKGLLPLKSYNIQQTTQQKHLFFSHHYLLFLFVWLRNSLYICLKYVLHKYRYSH